MSGDGEGLKRELRAPTLVTASLTGGLSRFKGINPSDLRKADNASRDLTPSADYTNLGFILDKTLGAPLSREGTLDNLNQFNRAVTSMSKYRYSSVSKLEE